MSRVILKEIISLKNQQNIYVIEDEGVFLYRKKKIEKITFSLRCRRKFCKKTLKVNPIYNVR